MSAIKSTNAKVIARAEEALAIELPLTYKRYIQERNGGPLGLRCQIPKPIGRKKICVTGLFYVGGKKGLYELVSVNMLNRQNNHLPNNILLIGETDARYYLACICDGLRAGGILLIDPSRPIQRIVKPSSVLAGDIKDFLSGLVEPSVKPEVDWNPGRYAFSNMRRVTRMHRERRKRGDGSTLVQQTHEYIQSIFHPKRGKN